MRVVERFGHELSGLDLTGIDLATSRDLPVVDFRGAELDDLVLTGATLEGVDLSRCNLRRVKAAGARLAHCRFDGSLIEGGDFTGATLDGARFVSSRVLRCSFAHASLVGTTFAKATIEESDFAGATFPGARFDLARFVDVSGLDPKDLVALDRANREKDEAELRYPAGAEDSLPARWSHLVALVVLGVAAAAWTRRRFPGRWSYRMATIANATSAIALGTVILMLQLRPAIGAALAWVVWGAWLVQAAGAAAVAFAALRLAAVELAHERRPELGAYALIVLPALAHAAWVAIDLAAWAMRWGALGE